MQKKFVSLALTLAFVSQALIPWPAAAQYGAYDSYPSQPAGLSQEVSNLLKMRESGKKPGGASQYADRLRREDPQFYTTSELEVVKYKHAEEPPAEAARAEEKPKTFLETNRDFFKEDVIENTSEAKVQDVDLNLEPFGYKIFTRQKEFSFSPILNAAAPPDYVVGPGDGLIVHAWNKLVDDNFAVEVNREGKINISKLGELYIWGLKFKDVEKLIEKEISKIYSECKVSVTLGKIRSIDVFVVGEVVTPGTYTISALSTVLNALMIAGGPTPTGTLRKIQLKRPGEEPKVIDLYSFLLSGDRNDDLRLNSQDTIFVPVVGDTVGIAGNVKRPGIYEMVKPVDIGELVKMAGGMTAKGYANLVQLIRTVNNEKRNIIDVDLSGKKSPITLKDGDLVKVFSIYNRASNYVTIGGNIERPGNYQWHDGMRVSELLKRGGNLLPNTYLEKAELKRIISGASYKYAQNSQSCDSGYELIYVDLAAIRSADAKSDIALAPMDMLKIFAKEEVRPQPRVTIAGAVFKPGIFELASNMRIRDLVFLSGNIRPEAYLEKAEIIRRKALYRAAASGEAAQSWLRKDRNGKETFDKYEHDLITVNLRKALEGDSEENILLENFDQVNILQISEGISNQVVTIEGEVKYPGKYIIKRGEKLSSVIGRAGGLTDQAFMEGAVFTRKNVQERQTESMRKLIMDARSKIAETSAQLSEKSDEPGRVAEERAALKLQQDEIEKIALGLPTGRITINLKSILSDASSEVNLSLENGDRLEVPQTPSDVTILGEVYNPGSVVYSPGMTLDYYLQQMGGLTSNADRSRVFIVRADGTTISKTSYQKYYSMLNFRYEKVSQKLKTIFRPGKFEDIVIERGDSVNVPTKVKVYSNQMKETIDLVYKLTLTFAGIKAAFR